MTERKSITTEKTCVYGIDYLDDKLGGIHKNELIIIGSYSGAGKTTAVEQIATANATQGRKVVFFRLEGDKYELGCILLWKRIYALWVEDSRPQMSDGMTYGNYRLNKLKGIEKYETQAAYELSETLENLYLFNKDMEMSKDTITEYLENMKAGGADLIIIDHLHYFDMFSDESENRQITDIMKAIKKATEQLSIPIVLVSHLRKKYDKKAIIPCNDDFMGSSNIFKVAYTCISIAGDYKRYDMQEERYPTIFRIAKSRAGVRDNSMAIKVFNGKLKGYEDKYSEGKVIKDNTDFQLYDDKDYGKYGKGNTYHEK